MLNSISACAKLRSTNATKKKTARSGGLPSQKALDALDTGRKFLFWL
jgi:hypothetical protein